MAASSPSAFSFNQYRSKANSAMTASTNSSSFHPLTAPIWPYAGLVFALVVLGRICFSSLVDYRKWIVFCNGAPPECDNFQGYCMFRLQRLYLLLVRDKGTTDTSFIRNYPNAISFLSLSESRRGERPSMVPWLLPQRQAGPYSIEPKWRARIKALLEEVVYEINAQYQPSVPAVQLGPSRVEGSGVAVLMADGCLPVCQDSETCLREVAHVHAQDASLHVILSPADAARVIEMGWAERFGWAGRASINGRLKGKRLPAGWVLVYSPRDEKELDIVRGIIKAGVAFALEV